MANERATAQVFLDGKQAEGVIDMLKTKANQLKQAIVEAGQAGDHVTMKKLEKELKGVNSSMNTLKKETFDVQKVLDNLSGASINDLNKALNKTNAEMKRMGRQDPGYGALKTQAKLLKAELAGVNNEMKVQQSWISRVGDGFNKYFGIITAGAASLAGAVMGFKKASGAYAEFTDDVADVQKTTGLAKDQVIELDQALQQVDTRTAQEDLLGLAKVAGKLGISAQEDVEGFVKAADKIAVALTEDLGGNIEESINDIGKLTDIFHLKENYGMEESMLKVGSAINSLGAASTANEGYIVEFTKRMAGVAPAANVSIDQIMGLGATLDQFGQTSEISSTTISAVLVDMFKSPGQYAEIAGISIKDFNTLLKTDSNEAFLKFLEGLKGNNGGLSEMANKLDGLGLEGKRSISVLGVLSNNTQTLREQQALSSQEFEKGTSLTNEFNIKNETTQAKLDKSRKEMALMTRELGENLSPAMLVSTNGVTYFIKGLSALIKLFKEHGTEILLIAGAIAAYTIALQVNTIKKKLNNTELILSNRELKLNAIWTKASSAAQKAWGTAVAVATGKITIAEIVTKLWNNTLKANPIGAVIALIMLLVAGTVLLVKHMNAQTVAQKAVNDVTEQAKRDIVEQKVKTEELLAVAKDEKKSLDERKAALAELNKISPEYFGNLSIEKSTTEDLTKAGEAYIANLEKQALIKAAQAKIDDLRTANANKEIDIQTKKTKWWESEAGAAKRANKAIVENKDAIKALQGIVDKNKNKTITSTVIASTEPTNPADPTKPKPVTDYEAANKKALEALETAHANEILNLKKYYSDKEDLDKEFKARMLASELAYLRLKDQMEPDELKKIELQSQIIDKQNEYTAALKEAAPAMLQNQDATQKTNEILLESSKLMGVAAKKQSDATSALDKLTTKQKQQADTIQMIGNVMTDYITSAIDGSTDQYQTFGNTLILMSLQILKNMVPVWAAQILGLSLASGESAATWGIAGMAKFAVVSGLMYAGISALEGQVKKNIGNGKAAGGFANPGGKYDPDGIYHKGEFINAQESVNNPTVRPVLDIIDFAQKNGTAASINLPAAMASKGLLPGKGKSSGGFASSSGSSSAESGSDYSGSYDSETKAIMKGVFNFLEKLDKDGVKSNINTREIFKSESDYQDSIKTSQFS